MAKSKSKRRARSGTAKKSAGQGGIKWGGATARPSDRRWTVAIFAVVAVAVVAAGLYWWQTARIQSTFMDLVAEGQGALSRVESLANQGRGHLAAGETRSYDSEQPTSGRHSLIWTKTGFHDRAQPAIQLVHALEHGNIVIYYDRPGAEVLATLDDWASLYGGQWDGVVATPQTGLGEGLVLTAWTKRLALERFDAAAAAAFIDAYRGRGPEQPVR